ncbi:MAG: 3-phosphoshikimate 1-carboxyvinyltransferase, partial [Candidatus Omnitrophota bacterium]
MHQGKNDPPVRLFGEITLPGDKSISHRAVMLGALANGRTTVKGVLDCDDCNYTIRAFKDMGVAIEKKDGVTTIEGKGLKGLRKPAQPINVGQSGTSMRIIAGILAGQDFDSTITGHDQLLSRPMKRVVEPLSLMGADIKARDGEYPPLVIKGGAVHGIDYDMAIPSAQIKSAILFAGLYSKDAVRVKEKFRSRDHTERMMKYFGADIKVRGKYVTLKGLRELEPKDLEIPGDISSASFFIAAAIILKGSRIRINRVGINPTRAGIIEILKEMGASLKILRRENKFEPVGDILVEYGQTNGIIIEEDRIPGIIDELPVIFVLAALSRGRTVIKGAGELRVKETDR